MRKLVILFIISTLNTFSQKDTLLFKKNFVYIKPFVLSSDVMQLNDLWASIGYDRMINKKNSIGFCIETIFHSKPSTAVFYGSGLNVEKSNGMRYNLEWKHFLKKRIYFSSNLLYQSTTSKSEETVVNYNLMFPVAIENEYQVKRSAFSVLPKIGVFWKKPNNCFFMDFSIGIGLKYISSKTYNKVNALSQDKESYSGKFFEYGSLWTYHPAFHIKTGFNF